MLNPDIQPTARLTLFSRHLARIASADIETLSDCPRHDLDAVCAVAVIMLFTAVYQTALFAVVGHRLFANPGEINPVILGVAAFIALFILKIDAYTIMRSGWHLSGVAELKRGGLDISGGPIARIKAGCLLVIRILLALGLAQLTAIFVCILVFAHDIDARVESDNRAANATVVAAATERVDADIQAHRDDIAGLKAEIGSTGLEADALRKRQADLMTSEPRLQEAQAEVTQLLTAKSKAEDELREAESFAINEAAGIRGAPSNSGQIGEGVRYRAASERAARAKVHISDAAAELTAARARLDALTKDFAARTEAARREIETQLASVERAIAEDRTRLAAREAHLSELTSGRDQTIRAAVVDSPTYIPRRDGFLIQIAALRTIADDNREVGIVIVLIEVTSFGFELAAVLAKVTSFVPTCYAAYLARDAYMRSVAIVDGMVRDLEGRDVRPASEPVGATTGPANDNHADVEAPPTAAGLNVPGDRPLPPSPPKRRRGRPRKARPESATSEMRPNEHAEQPHEKG